MTDYWFEYDRASYIIAARITGAFNDDVFRTWYAIAPRYLDGLVIRGAVVDFTGVTRFEVSTAAIRVMAAKPPILPDPTARYVVASQDHIYGLSRMFQALSPKGREHLHVVRSIAEAHGALGLTEPHFERLPDLT